jgi:hypothetical protein
VHWCLLLIFLDFRVMCFVCLHSVSWARCFMCLWVIHSQLSLRFSPTFIYNIQLIFCKFIWHMEMSDFLIMKNNSLQPFSTILDLPIDTSWQEFPFKAQYEFLGEQTQCPRHVWAEHRRIRSRYPPGINWNWWCITGLINPTCKSWKVFLIICLCSICVWYIIWRSNILTLNVPDEGYSRNVLYTLNLISTFLYRCVSQIYSQYDIIVVTY